jgi:aldehyde dehydrogenase (NAD+)
MTTDLKQILTSLGLDPAILKGGDLEVYSPNDGSLLGRVQKDTAEGLDKKIGLAVEAFGIWREVPAPQRGELVRRYGDKLRQHKKTLGALVTLENGKLLEEGLGEVQEMIDICDFAVGLSRQLYGLTIASERPGHKMTETWHPLGVVGVISAFNFPVAVWSWNSAIALVCGDPVIWKPSDKTPITAIACQHLFDQVAADFEAAPAGLSQIVIVGRDIGQNLVDDPRVPLISATGSTAMGRAIGPRIAARFGRAILELGGNNAIIVGPSADLDLTVRGVVFGAVGTCGQRCTSTRRLIVHEEIYGELLPRLRKAYQSIPVGNPMEVGNLVGPLIDGGAFEAMEEALVQAEKEGGTISGGGRTLANKYPDAYYVNPAIVEMPAQSDIVRDETFAPILYVMRYKNFDEALALHNDVPQGLSSAIFTNEVKEAERFTSVVGSDCGIANVNIGTSGAEIGGAFGGEKETGGGRESGSDSWKAYMRRSTSTVNYTSELPLAQGIKFDI